MAIVRENGLNVSLLEIIEYRRNVRFEYLLLTNQWSVTQY